jgi:hypothetical protein
MITCQQCCDSGEVGAATFLMPPAWQDPSKLARLSIKNVTAPCPNCRPEDNRAWKHRQEMIDMMEAGRAI